MRDTWGVQKSLHALVILALLVAELAPAAAYAAPVYQEELPPIPTGTTTTTATYTETPTPTATETVSSTPPYTPTLTATPPYTPSVTPTLPYTPTEPAEPAPLPIPSETPTTLPTPTATALPTATPEAPAVTPPITPSFTPTGTASPTLTVTPTATIPPVPGISLTLEVKTPNIKAGGVLHTGWQVEGWQDGMVLTLMVPVSFTLQVNPGGDFDPETGSLTVALTKDHDKAGWRIPDDLEGPYPITVTLSLEGTVVATDNLVLEETGLTHIPASGGQAKGFNDKVRVIFPVGAAEESMKVYVHPPREDTTPPDSLSGEPIEILARGKVSKQWLHQFNQPLTIELEWGAEQPAATLYSYDETTATWLPLPTEIDRQAGVLRATTTHLSIFDTNIEDWQKAQMPDISAFQVAQFTGAAVYDYPIWTPPGPAGLQPSLSLSYNSQVVDSAIAPMTQASWVGMGWSLDTGYVVRQMHGTMDNLEDDTFLLVVGGVSSLLLKGSDGKYHLADENYWKVSYDTPTDTWTVWDKEGNRYIFGNSAGDRADYPAYDNNCSTPTTHETWKWALSEVRNKFNQAITYDYAKFQQTTEDPCTSDTHTTDMAIYPATITYPNSQYSIVFTRQARSDIRNEWDDADARTFYENQRLSYISVKRSTTTVRKYQFYYDDYVYPGYTWDQGGRTFEMDRIQVSGVNAHGDLDNNLPEVNFTYDGLHLTQATNGYGGSITFAYESTPWYDVDNNENYQYDYDDTCDNGWTGGISCPIPGTSKIGINGTGYHIFGSKAWQPGVAYHLSTQITNKSSTYQDVTVKLQYGPNETTDTLLIGSSTTHGYNVTLTYENTVILPKTANQLRWIITCSSCWVLGAEATALPTRYRVTSRTVAESLTGQSNVWSYEYDDPGSNDLEHSEAIASGQPLYGMWYDEYRGNAMVRETGPAGTDGKQRVTTTWFYQDDHRKGQAQGSLVSVNSVYDTFNSLDSNKWVFQTGIQSAEKISGDKALKNPSYSTNWSSNFYRNSHSLTDNEAALVSFRLYGSSVETVLAAEHGDWGGADYRRWGIYVTTTGNVKVQYYVGTTQPAPYEYSTGYTVAKDTWYNLLIILDNSKLYLRVWERGDPQNYFNHWISGFSEPDGQTWRFHNWVNQNGGIVFLDAYTEMNIYQLSFNQVDTTHNLYEPLASPFSTYEDLEIAWSRVTSQQSWNYEGEGSLARGTATYNSYETSSQGSAQYGNLTHQVESYWNDTYHYFTDFRVTWNRFYPNTTNANLVGLPAYSNLYACPSGTTNGNCQDSFSSDNSNLLASQIYIYDNHGVTYSTPPSEGKLTNERTLLRFAGANYTDPKYADSAYHYDTWGNRDTVTAYTGEGTSAAFASSGAQTTTNCYGLYSGTTCSADSYHTYLGWEKNHLGHYTRYQYDYDFGLPRWMQAPNLAVTEADFDNFGRLYKLVKPGDTLSDPTLKVVYDFDTISYWVIKTQLLTPGSTSQTVGYYNGLGQLVQAQTKSAEINVPPVMTRDIIVDSKYDPYGNIKSQSVPYDVSTGSVYRTPASQPDTLTTYDILGRVLEVTAPDYDDDAPIIESYAYHVGNTVHSDAKGNQQTTNYDIQGRAASIVPPTGPQVTYDYDKLDRLKTITRGGVTVSIGYDQASRKTSMNDPDMGAWSYSYDALGNLKYQDDAKDQRICLYYDNLNRLIGKYYTTDTTPCPTSPAYVVAYTYDAQDPANNQHGRGYRTGMTDSSGSTSWKIDPRGRVWQESKAITGSGTFVTQWGYNSADLQTSMIYPGGNAGQAGETVSYAYLPQMALETVSGSVNYVSDTLYDAAGRVELRKLGGTAASPTLQTDFTYFSWTTANGWGRLKRITGGTPADTDSLQDLRYYSSTDTSQYDANGNLLNIYDYLASSPQTQTFTYDSLDRLVSARASGGTEGKYGYETYSYDSATGNLSAKAGLAYSYDANHPHAVTQVDGVQQYWYDANGNQNKRTIGNPGQNLAPNPGFETSSNWTGAAVSQFQGTSFYRSTWGTADSHSETYAYAVSNHAYGYLQSDSIDISGSTQYNLYAYVRGEIDADDSSGEWIIRAYYYDSGGGAISYQDVAKGTAGSLTTIWQQKGGVITTPANADSLRIQLFNYMNTGWVAYDEVSLKLGTGQNMVTNPGFESIGNWSENPSSIYPGTSFYRSNWGPAAPYTGSYAYVISNHAYGYLLSDTIQVSAGVQYDLYAYVRGEIDPEGSAGYWLIRAYYYKSDGSSNGSLDVASGDPTTINTTWQQKGGRITTPANTATLRVALFNYHNSGWVAFDDVSLVQFCFGCYTNLVTNGDFEGTTGWSEITASQYPATSFYRSTWGIAAPHGGSYAYTISNLGYGSLDSDKINVSANTTYDAYAWVRGELDAEDGLGNWILLLRHYDSANNLVRSDYIDQGGPDTISTTWQQKGGRFTTPSNGAKVSIQLWIQLGSGWVTYDDVSLRPVVTYNLSYDAENRLSGVSGATTASFVYDGDGVRVKATAGGVTTAYVGNYFEWTGSTSTMVKYYYAGTTRIAMRVGSNNPKWLLSDHLGSQSIVASYDGLTEEGELRYKAWGEIRYTSGTTPTKRQYTGQLSEMTTIGLYFYGARFYDPYLNRWIQPDSIIPEASQGVQAWDRYAYANNNPIRYTDPSGHCIDGISTALCIAIGVGAVAGGIAGGAGYIAAAKITKQEINLKSLAIAVGGGVLAGALTPVVAVLAPSASSAIAGTLALNGTVTAAQYVADQTVNEKPVSATTTVANFGIGVIGGTIGGTYTPFDEIGKEGISQGLKLSIEFGKNAVTQFEKETSAQFLRYQARIGASNVTVVQSVVES